MKPLLFLALWLACSASAFAQAERDFLNPRLFSGVGVARTSTQALAGVGLDLNFRPELAVAVDGDLWFNGEGAGLGTLLVGVTYRFNPSRPTFAYLRGGFAGYALSDATHGLHFGAGIEHRLNRNFALQAEGLVLTTNNSNLELRLGLVFH